MKTMTVELMGGPMDGGTFALPMEPEVPEFVDIETSYGSDGPQIPFRYRVDVRSARAVFMPLARS